MHKHVHFANICGYARLWGTLRTILHTQLVSVHDLRLLCWQLGASLSRVLPVRLATTALLRCLADVGCQTLQPFSAVRPFSVSVVVLQPAACMGVCVVIAVGLLRDVMSP